jgi:hypothetical protein
LEVDDRDFQQGLYRIEYKEGGNTAVLIRPTLPAVFRFDKAEFETRVTERHFQSGQDVARAIFNNLPENRKLQRITLQFDSHVKLTQDPFLEAGLAARTDGDTVKASVKQIAYPKHTGRVLPNGANMVFIFTRASWRFADRSHAVQLVTRGNEERAAADAAFQGW